MTRSNKLPVVPGRRNFYRFSPPVFDFEFRREGDEIVLAFPNKRALLDDNGQTPATTFSERDVVMFFTHSSTRFGRIYKGSLRANFVPDGGKLPCALVVPSEPNRTVPPASGFPPTLILSQPTFTVGP